MLKQCVKVAVVIATSVVAVPYALAVLASALYGWPPGPNGCRRALHPRRVFLLNYALLRNARKLRYARLMLRARWRHSLAPSSRMCKDVTYGSSENNLDVYYPREGGLRIGRRSVVVFVYGGTWGSGDKSMYTLLCSNLADTLNTLVVCPNYSTYPKGNVDDMIQDIVDCITWVHRHADNYGGDKDRIMLMGHSAGAHLCVMALLELVMKRIIHHPHQALLPQPAVATTKTDPISFTDTHFDGSNGENSNGDEDTRQVTSTNSGSFYVVDEKKESMSKNTDSFCVVVGEAGESKMATSDASGATYESAFVGGGDEAAPSIDLLTMSLDLPSGGDDETGKKIAAEVTESTESVQTELGMVCRRSVDATADDAVLSQSQREVKNILSSIKLIVGLSGVYNVAEHYRHECKRGVEGISTMARAMYGPDQFDRFSPSYIVKNLPDNTALPPIHLMHGENDETVPPSSSLHFQLALQEMAKRDVAPVTVIPDCDHLEICMGLMDPVRHMYGRLMHSIVDLARPHLS